MLIVFVKGMFSLISSNISCFILKSNLSSCFSYHTRCVSCPCDWLADCFHLYLRAYIVCICHVCGSLWSYLIVGIFSSLKYRDVVSNHTYKQCATNVTFSMCANKAQIQKHGLVNSSWELQCSWKGGCLKETLCFCQRSSNKGSTALECKLHLSTVYQNIMVIHRGNELAQLYFFFSSNVTFAWTMFAVVLRYGFWCQLPRMTWR